MLSSNVYVEVLKHCKCLGFVAQQNVEVCNTVNTKVCSTANVEVCSTVNTEVCRTANVEVCSTANVGFSELKILRLAALAVKGL